MYPTATKMQHQIVRYRTFVSKSEKTVVLLIAREQKNHPRAGFRSARANREPQQARMRDAK
jgi:hypothetical protein